MHFDACLCSKKHFPEDARPHYWLRLLFKPFHTNVKTNDIKVLVTGSTVRHLCLKHKIASYLAR